MKNVMLIGALLASSITLGQDIDWSTIPDDKVVETISQQEKQISAWVDYTKWYKSQPKAVSKPVVRKSTSSTVKNTKTSSKVAYHNTGCDKGVYTAANGWKLEAIEKNQAYGMTEVWTWFKKGNTVVNIICVDGKVIAESKEEL